MLLPRPKSEAIRRAVELGFASWLTITILSQHPNTAFDRLRTADKVGLLIPNWRFFAPTPAQHDYHLLYRTLDTDGEQSAWQSASQINKRKWAHAVWFPGRRQEKAIFDVCGELGRLIVRKDVKVADSAAYRLLRDFVIRHLDESDPRRVSLTGFQFLVVLYSGHDDSEDPQYSFISPFIRLSEPDPTDHAGDADHTGAADQLEHAA
ncbi:hypothetical protein G4Z16_25355 [Streptomyces bathyalis]|uniref:Uncharacterized protein n=1 Tax=Streptomyces bathyalis TaxID=2710756 RepID=A0A7T1WSH5_9ACTN|nr:hypothetical protein [Streptomyces bathyalis]QPP09188.1 hypothetical protein G4Z16_25355 [Streptomyces bathyalis]